MDSWYILSDNFPDETPVEGKDIHLLFTAPARDKKAPVVRSSVMTTVCDKHLFEMAGVMEKKGFRIFWRYVQVPRVSEDARVLYPSICGRSETRCEYDDNGYCLKRGKCEHKVPHPELSAW